MLRKQLNRKILKGLNSGNADGYTYEGTCFPGPKFACYIDRHDKLKLYGFTIHGCIDGFSRRMLQLEVSTSNKMPEIVAKYYVDAVRQYGMSVNVNLGDGTEHSLVQPIQLFFKLQTVVIRT